MLNIIKSDFYRISKGKAIYIVLAAILCVIAFSIFSMTPIYLGPSGSFEDGIVLSEADEEAYSNAGSIFEERAILKKYPYPLDKAILSANANLYYFFIVVVVLVLSADFSNGTIKNTISSSISRKNYYLSKLAAGLLLCTLLTLFNSLAAYFGNLLVNGKAFCSPFAEIGKLTLWQLPLMYGIVSLLICICTLVKRTAIFNTITMPLLIAFQVFLLTVISIFKLNPDLPIFNYEYQTALTRLAQTPANAIIIKYTVLGVLYIAVFNFIGYLALKRSEIK